MTLQSEVAALLEARGVGTRGVDLFDNGLTPAPDAQVAIQEYGGDAPEFLHDRDGVGYELRRFQLSVRAPSFDAAQLLAEAAHGVLTGVRNTTLSGTWYRRIVPLQSPFPLGQDQNGRHRFACNYRAEKRPSAG